MLLSFTLQYIWLISLTQFWSYIESLKLYTLINYLAVYPSYNDMSEYHLLIIHTYNYIYTIESRPSLSFTIMHKVLWSYKMIFKSDFMLKIPITCIHFRNQSMFIKIVMFW